jgi:hypothetical protein
LCCVFATPNGDRLHLFPFQPATVPLSKRLSRVWDALHVSPTGNHRSRFRFNFGTESFKTDRFQRWLPGLTWPGSDRNLRAQRSGRNRLADAHRPVGTECGIGAGTRRTGRKPCRDSDYRSACVRCAME